MLNKNKNGFGLIQVIVTSALFTLLAFFFSTWSVQYFKNLDNTSQKVNLSTANKIISQYLDCCETYKGYFGDTVYPANVPLDDSMFISGPVTLLDSGRNDLKRFVKPWQIQGVPGGLSLNIEYGENIRANKNYLGRDVSTLKTRDQFSGEQYNKKCQYNINHCIGSGSTSSSVSTSVSVATSTSTSPATSTSPSGSGTTGGSSTSSTSSSGGTTTTTATAQSDGDSTSSSNGNGPSSTSSTSSSGNDSSSSSTSSTGASSSTSSDCPDYPAVPCGCAPVPRAPSPICAGNPACVLTCSGTIAANESPPLPPCSQAGCNGGGMALCNCQSANIATCIAGREFTIALACGWTDLATCWLNCKDQNNAQVILCGICCMSNYCPDCMCFGMTSGGSSGSSGSPID